MRRDDKPLVGIPTCTVPSDAGPLHKVNEKYITSVVNGARAMPVLIPAIGDLHLFDALMDRLDGLLLTGSPSNVEPLHYGGPAARAEVEKDPARDATTLPMIRHAIAQGVPILAICRGHQELNVALGGTLHQHVQELPGKRDHRMDRTVAFDEKYKVRHMIDIQPGGLLERLNGGLGPVGVNTLHQQAVDRPGDGLFVEAISDDGVIEAVSLPSAQAFTLGVQWHPEHPHALQWPLSRAMYQAFGDACRARMARLGAERAA